MLRQPSFASAAGLAATLLAATLLAATFLAGCPKDPETEPEWGEAFDAREVGWLLSVWGATPDDVYTVGGTPGTVDGGVVVHFDGDAWREVVLGVEVPLLNWVYGFGSDEVFVVGDRGTVLHWDGASWRLQPTPTEQNLWGGWGASPDDLWAVGGNGREAGQQTVLRYDGDTWREVTLPGIGRPGVMAFFKVWGTAADDVWIVGQRGAILHWDGNALEPHLPDTSRDLISVWGTGPDRVAAVGGRGNGVIATWDGTAWHTASLAPLPGLNGVWMGEPDVIHAVGQLDTVVRIDFETLEVTEDFRETGLDFHGVFGQPGTRLVAVGGNLASPSGPFEAVALTRPLGDDDE